MKTICFTAAAAHDLDRLNDEAREEVMAGLTHFAITGSGDVKRLVGLDGYRLRIGNYRVIFEQDATTILAIYLGRRSTTTYKKR